MTKSRQLKVYKIAGIIILLLLIVLILGFLYVNKIATGSNVGEVPAGYTVVNANGHSFSTKISGDKQGIPVILLHGFPESSIMWKDLMSDLNDNGYYTIAPDQRGYSHMARPDDTEQYNISHLTRDVIAIADSLGIGTFHLITHDWGSAVGWQLASDYPERLRSFTALSVPHLAAFSRAYQEDSTQYAASDYIRNFQTGKLPEYTLAKNDYAILKSIWSAHEEEEVASYIDLLSQENALTAAINWYRANYDAFEEGFDTGKIDVPVLFVWGKNDKAIKRSGIDWTEEYIENYYRFVEVDAGHWLIQESYDEVQGEILSHLEKF